MFYFRILFFSFFLFLIERSFAQTTQKPVIHGKHWMAITGKPLAATAGATVFQQGGNAVDAACGQAENGLRFRVERRAVL